jgi:hypothetical protein
MNTAALRIIALLWLAPILIFFSCLGICIRQRNYLGEAGSLACFMT